eukprot:SAG22_NODE_639_length_8255_cov_13.659882_14_plen_84_part_00
MQVSDPTLRSQLLEVEGVGTQPQNKEAAALFVLCADSRRHQLIAAQEVRSSTFFRTRAQWPPAKCLRDELRAPTKCLSCAIVH